MRVAHVLNAQGVALALALTAGAQGPSGADQPGQPDSADDRLTLLEQRLGRVERLSIERQPRVVLSGYLDVGFFVAAGNGSGFVQDVGPVAERAFPGQAERHAWVFLGDILAPAINSRGDPADLGDAPGTTRFDGIDSNGAPGFIANELHLALRAAVTEAALVRAAVGFAPRRGTDFRSGDAFAVDLAELEWMLGAQRRTSLFVGKIDPVFGIEYRERESDRRWGITPTLLARYTSGTPVGVKLRSKLGQRLVVAAAVTNGSSGVEGFHFHDDVDSNAGKTGSARVSVAFLDDLLEVGLSGEYGAQDLALDSGGTMWLAGVDLQARLGPLALKGQWMRGGAAGEGPRRYREDHRPFGLRLRDGAYLEGNVFPVGWLGLLARAELRDANVWLGDPAGAGGADRLYLTRSWRAVLGARARLGEQVVLKVEVLRNGEYGGVPAIPNDVITSSLVLIY